MPIEIKEVVIKTLIEGSPETREAFLEDEVRLPSGEARAELVEECVDRVLEILKQKTER